MSERDFDQLAAAVLEGSATPEQYVALESELDANPDAFDRFVRLSEVHATLGWELQYSRVATTQSQPQNTIAPERTASASRANGFRIGPAAWSIAAALLLTAAVVAVYVFVVNAEPADPEPGNWPIATLIDATGDVLIDNDIANAGGEYAAGDYSIDAGRAEFLLTNRVTVDLRGKTRLAMHGDMLATLSLGTATFECPPGAEGYTVHLPGDAKVIDLGTRFRVTVDEDGERSVRVTEGSVRIETPAATQIVKAPMLARLDDAGAVALSNPHRVDIDFTAEAFGEPSLPADWTWDSPGQASYDLGGGEGLRVDVPADHNAWNDRGLAPILRADESLPGTYVLETEVELVDGPIVMGSVVLYDGERKHFALSLGLIRDPGIGVQAALELPGRKLAQVPVDATRAVLRLERTDDRFIASYRLPDETEWHRVAEVNADTVAGDATNHHAGLMSKAWHSTPGIVNYRTVQIMENESLAPENARVSQTPTPD